METLNTPQHTASALFLIHMRCVQVTVTDDVFTDIWAYLWFPSCVLFQNKMPQILVHKRNKIILLSNIQIFEVGELKISCPEWALMIFWHGGNWHSTGGPTHIHTTTLTSRPLSLMRYVWTKWQRDNKQDKTEISSHVNTTQRSLNKYREEVRQCVDCLRWGATHRRKCTLQRPEVSTHGVCSEEVMACSDQQLSSSEDHRS